jgi:tetratricopeptide (TPR) repeat protein
MKYLTLTLVCTLSLSLLAGTPKLAEAKKLLAAKQPEEAVKLLEPDVAADSKDVAAKALMASALFSAGETNMLDPNLPPMRKYPAALRYFRRVLQFDKNNAKAKSNIDMIEGIYKSMGRPVPQ